MGLNISKNKKYSKKDVKIFFNDNNFYFTLFMLSFIKNHSYYFYYNYLSEKPRNKVIGENLGKNLEIKLSGKTSEKTSK